MLIDGYVAPAKLVPVVTVHSDREALEIARALAAGGLRTIEIVLRSKAALSAIARVTAELPEVIVGAGSVRTSQDVVRVKAAGARFVVSPGSTPALIDAVRGCELPYLPGASTPSEIMSLAEQGFTTQKIFPITSLGGLSYLNSLTPIFSEINFCPTGGLGLADVKSMLAIPNVIACGGSWMVSSALVKEKRWSRITQLAQEASIALDENCAVE